MLRSMYSGISGLKNFQTKLDVIGNNIANVNTFGFKKGRVVFKDMISQSVAGASAATDTRGGVNPKQVGLGSQIAAIDTIHTGGNLQSTNRLLDLAISGDGYFILGQASTTAGSSGSVTVDANGNQVITPSSEPTTTGVNNLSYTRAGNFYLDNQGFLVNNDGLYVLGSQATVAADGTTTIPPLGDNLTGTGSQAIYIPTDAKEMAIGTDGTITYIAGSDAVDANGNVTVAAGDLVTAGKLAMAKFPNTSGLQKIGSNQFQPTANSGEPIYSFSGELGTGTMESGMLEMSNVDLSEEFTEMIVAQRAFQANTRIITTSDEILQELTNLKR